METLIIFIVAAIIFILLVFFILKDKPGCKSCSESKDDVEGVKPIDIKPTTNGTVLDLTALDKHGYGDLSLNAPIEPPYSFFFFIVKYKTVRNKIHYALGVSRGFEEIRIIKNSYYDDVEDFTITRIEKLVNPFNLFVDDVRFNELVCKYRENCIIEVVKRV